MKNILMSFWFWGFLLVAFVTIIMWDEKIEDNVKGEYKKHKMTMNDVNFSSIDKGFESARIYADIATMDDNQNNMEAQNIRVMMFKQEIATWSGRLIAEKAIKSPFEYKFQGDVRVWNSDNERFRTDEMRYFISRKEAFTQKPVTMLKDNAVVTGVGMVYNTETREMKLNDNVVIRIWSSEEKKQKQEDKKVESMTGLPVAPPLEQILPKQVNIASETTDKRSQNK